MLEHLIRFTKSQADAGWSVRKDDEEAPELQSISSWLSSLGAKSSDFPERCVVDGDGNADKELASLAFLFFDAGPDGDENWPLLSRLVFSFLAFFDKACCKILLVASAP